MKLSLDARCPCGKKRPLVDCCWRGGRLVVLQANTKPPRPVTGYAHQKCYARALGDCGTKISGEHIVSKVIQKRIAGPSGKLTMTDYSDGKPVREIRSSVANLKAAVLCKRHNEALSRTDEAADHFFEAWWTMTEIMSEKPPREPPALAINGHDLERWLLKFTCGLMASKREDIPEVWLRILFSYVSMRLPWGLHMNARIGDVKTGVGKAPVNFTFVRSNDDGRCEGSIVSLAGMDLILSMTETRIGVPEEAGSKSVPRPNGLDFENPKNGRAFTIAFTWQGPASGQGIHMTWSAEAPAPPL